MTMTRTGTCMALSAAVLLLPGCVAKAAWDVATLPVKAGAQAADWATTSGEEADRNRGRELRKRCKENYDPNYCDKR
ncbi:MAG: hypothetical protein ABW184_17665 [Sphingobium sp.]